MDDSESLSHSKWECKYHVIFIPKCRCKTLYEQLRPHLGHVFKRLSEYKESRIEEGHLMPDHVPHVDIDSRSIRYRKLSSISKGKVQFTWHEYMVSASVIL
jgi:REP element-mobilizing transposase RayT